MRLLHLRQRCIIRFRDTFLTTQRRPPTPRYCVGGGGGAGDGDCDKDDRTDDDDNDDGIDDDCDDDDNDDGIDGGGETEWAALLSYFDSSKSAKDSTSPNR